MEAIGKDTLDRFTDITGFDVVGYLSSYKSFVSNQYPNVVSYYKGISVPNRESFKSLEKLVKDTDDLHGLINVHTREMDNYEYWILMEKLTEIRSKIDSIVNISKWLRSSIVSGSYNRYITTTHTMEPKQTLESISRNVNDDPNPNNDWVSIAINNDLIEEDYTSEGGTVLKVNNKSSVQLYVQSVVDNLTNENIYGRDLNRIFTFDVESQDLQFLDESGTLMQSIDILGNLKTGNNPKYPGDGITKDAVVGQPLSVVAYPVIIRQLQQSFATDDTIKSITITDIAKDGDTIKYTYVITTVLDEQKQNNTLAL